MARISGREDAAEASPPALSDMEAVERDIEEVFGFSKDDRPQDRAHGYIDRNRVQRGFSDTAMMCAALHMARRAYAAGRADAMAEDGALQRKAAMLARMSADLLELSAEMRGIGSE